MRDAAKQRSTRMLPFEPFDDALVEIVVRPHQGAALVPGGSASLADQDPALWILAAFRVTVERISGSRATTDQ